MNLDAIKRELQACGVTGPHVSHPRRGNIAKIRGLLDGDTEAAFGLSGTDRYSAGEILGFMSELTGCSDDLEELDDRDFIDPDRTVTAMRTGAGRLAAEAGKGSTLLACTGHPTGILEHHLRVVDAYRAAGGKILQARAEEPLDFGRGRSEVRYVGGVGCLADGASLKHTHSSKLMEVLLETGPRPDLVLADHGFAGAAIERGIPTVAVMDINDQALSIPWAEKKDVVIIPLDDNRPPRCYEPSWRLFEDVIAAVS